MTRIRKSNGAGSDSGNEMSSDETPETESNVNQESQTETNLQAATNPIDPETKEGLAKLLEVIEQTVERYSSNDEERELLRTGVTDVIKEALHGFTHPQRSHLRESMTLGAGRPDMSQVRMGGVNDGAATGNGTTERAMAAATKGAKDVGMGFVEFTQGLITGTFNAVIKATIDQMQAYTDMVADLTKSLKDFAADTITDSAVSEKLSQLAAQDKDGKILTIEAQRQKDINHLRKLYALAPATGGHKTQVGTIFGCPDDKAVETALSKGEFTSNASTYEPNEIITIKQAIKYGLARDGMNQLRQMAREGMARIVITEGEIHTKLTFTMKSDESNAKNTHTEDKTDAGVDVKAGVSYGGGPWKASVDVNAHYNRLQVNTVDEKSTSNINLATEMIGEVRIKFKTDYQPLSGRGDVREADLAPIT